MTIAKYMVTIQETNIQYQPSVKGCSEVLSTLPLSPNMKVKHRKFIAIYHFV